MDELYQMGQEFLRRGDKAVALLVFDMQVSTLLDQEILDSAEYEFFEVFERYFHLLFSLMSHDLPLANHQWRRVFGIKGLADNHYLVQEGTFLFKKFASNRFTFIELNLYLKERLGSLLRRRVLAEEYFCRTSGIFVLPCPFFTVDGHCPHEPCPDEHLPKSSLNAAQYNTKVDDYLQQIRILGLAYSTLPQGRNAR